MKQKVFITGGLGFIGSHLVRRFVREGYIVRIFDNYSSGLTERIADVIQSVEVIKGDILDKKAVTRAMRGADIVSHHAAQLEITKAMKDPYFDLSSNTVGTLNILEACLTNKVKKLINASSACVYGQTDGKRSRETDANNPNWAYGVSKLTAEKYCSIYYDMYKLPIVSFRYAIIYGPDEWYGRVMTIFVKCAVEGKPLIVFGDGSQTRDFTHVSQVVDANMVAMKRIKTGHQIYNVSTGRATSVAQLAALISQISPNHPKVIFDPATTPGKRSKLIDRMRLPNELMHLVLSPLKLKKMLNVSPTISLGAGLKQQIEWLSAHRNRWTTMSY